jgi:hypothetical protein
MTNDYRMRYDDELKIIFSERLKKLLTKMEDDYDDYIAYEMNWMADTRSKYANDMNISSLDISDSAYFFDAIIGNKKQYIKIGTFLRSYFPGVYDEESIRKFSTTITQLKKGVKVTVAPVGTKLEHKPFKYNPKDVRSTFLSLVTKTYPHFNGAPHEKEVLKFLPQLETDKFGNYYKVIAGDNTTMFTSHLDTADRKQVDTVLFSKMEDGDEYIYTDGMSILGADDKAGVAVMLYMMTNNIPGIYYFFIGEERGGIGSRDLASEFDTFDYLKNIKRCVSFDRRKTGSVITSQYGRVCCSNEFGGALCKEYNKSGLNLSIDPTGVFTDSASFMDDIPECTNVSVGYNNEHTGREIQNMTYLIKLAEASLKVNWSGLPTVRKVGLNEEILRKHRPLINDLKKYVFGLDVKTVGYQDKIFVKIDTDTADVKSIFDTLSQVQGLMYKYKNTDSYVTFDDAFIKIELR